MRSGQNDNARLAEPPQFPFLLADAPLLKRLRNDTASTKLTLISAPFGYGKTVLLSQLFEQSRKSGMRAIWIGLSRDIEFGEFLNGLLRSLVALDKEKQTGKTNVTAAERTDVVGQLLDGTPTNLYIDGLDCCNNPPMCEFLSRIMSANASQVKVFATHSRCLTLDTARARLEGRLRVFTAADLVLGPSEVRVVLGPALCEYLRAPEIDLIVEQTEGWPVAARLLQITLASSPRPFEALAQYSGTDKDLVALLRCHFLDLLDNEKQNLLMELALLPEISSEAVESTVASKNCLQQLEWLSENNQFLTPNDRSQVSFHMHGLIRQFLIHEGHRRLDSGRRRKVLERASAWARHNGRWKEAMECALEAGSPKLAAKMLDEIAPTWVGQRGRVAEYIRWVQRLRLLGSPLSIEAEYWYLWSLVFSRQTRAAYVQSEVLWSRLQTERTLAHAPNRLLDLRKRVEEIKIGVNVFGDQLAVAGRDAAEWLESTEHRNEISVATVACAVALSALSNFEFDTARNSLRTATTAVGSVGSSYGESWVALLASLTDLYDGQYLNCYFSLKTAMEKTCTALGDDAPILGTMALVAGQCALEMGLLDEAREHARSGLDHMEVHGLNETAFCALSTALRLWGGDDGTEFSPERLYSKIISYPEPTVQVFGCFAIQRLLKLDRIDDALHLCEQTGVHIESNVPDLAIDVINQTAFLRELASFTQLSYFFSIKNLRRANTLCEFLLGNTDQHRRRARVVELEIMAAMLASHSEASTTAVRHVARAIRLAASRGIVFPFLNYQAELSAIVAQTRSRDWVFGEPQEKQLFSLIGNETRQQLVKTADAEGLVLGQLTARELQMLRFIAMGFSNQQIVDRTGMSLATVKWHLYNLYSKLDVRSRSAATVKARGMHLI